MTAPPPSDLPHPGRPGQLVLPFPPAPGSSLPEILPHAGQADAQAWLARPQDWPLGRLALWGPAGSGKSLLAAHWAAARNGTVLPTATDEWPRTPIALDGIDHVPDEPALLHLLNAAQEARCPALLLSRSAPSRLPVRLPDLASRLRATTAVHLGPPDETYLALLLARLLAERQLRLPAALQAWLLSRLPRTERALQDAVARLDAAAAQSGRTITRPMATEILGLLDPGPRETQM